MPRLGGKLYTRKYLRRFHRRAVLEYLSADNETNPDVLNQNGQCVLDRYNGGMSPTDNVTIDSLNEFDCIIDDSDSSIISFNENSHDTHVPKAVPKDETDVFVNELRKIAYMNNASQTIMQRIIDLIRPKYPFLPQSARTLLGTPKARKTIELDSGKMVYFGVESGLVRKLCFETNNVLRKDVIDISMDCNIDGLPIFKSSKTQFWPISARSTTLADKRPFVVAIFCGTEKPQPLDLFLQNFIDEMETLQLKGFIYNNQCYRVKIRCFTCDAPARAMLKSISSHTSFHGCERCKHKATKVDNRLFYPITHKTFGRRKDEHFHSEKLSKHIKVNKSPLSKLVGLVSQFVLDPMHLIYLGVTKRLIKKYWLGGKRQFRLSRLVVQKLVDELSLKLKDHIPNDFGRKCRGFSDVDRWKATEFRLFLLYTGPVLICDVLNKDQYSHFLLLHTAVFILSNKTFTSRYLEVARKALSDFVSQSADLYGPQFVVYNVHSLLHVCDDVGLYGNLEEYSCFPYENYLGELKKRIRSKKQPLSQICNRLREADLIIDSEKVEITEYTAKGITYTADDLNSFQCKSLITRKFKIFTERPNNVVMVNKQICSIKSINFIAGAYKCIGIPFMYVQDLYDKPLPSSKLGIYFVRGSREATTFAVSDIAHKCVCLPHKNGFTVFPLLHQKK